jgi:hypothetical protein
LFDRVCAENGIRHLLTAPRSPTTTGKIERFHGTARRELLNATVFDSTAHAQQVIAAWVDEYNTDRPHQSLGPARPVQRFTTTRVATADAGPPLRLTSLAADRGGQDWVTRRVASNGVISVAWQQVSVGKHRGGEVVDIHVRDRLLEVWSGNDLIRTIARDNTGPVRKTPRLPPPLLAIMSSINRARSVNPQPSIDRRTTSDQQVLRQSPPIRTLAAQAWHGSWHEPLDGGAPRRHVGMRFALVLDQVGVDAGRL